jgi:hypothetical protein
MVDLMFVPNKRPGACFYCARRVKTGEGSLWRSSQGFHVAHGDCLHKNISAGKEPERMDSRSTAAWLVKEVRAVLKAVRMDGTEAELEGAVARMRAVLTRGEEGVPF